MRSSEVLDLLKARYAAPEWALLFEVGNATGFACNRHTDAVAMSLWPSRGLHLHGFEVKVSTSDWRRELKKPEKADESAFQYMDYWWIVAAHGVTVTREELPTTWGLIKVNDKGKLVQVYDAPKLKPRPVDPPFLAALLRRLHEQTIAPSASAVKKARGEGWEEGHEVGKKHAQQWQSGIHEDVKKFEEQSGIRIRDWKSGKIGAAAKRLVAGEELQATALRRIGELRRQAERIIEDCDEVLKPVEEASKEEATS